MDAESYRMKKKGAFWGAEAQIARVYGAGRREAVAERVELLPQVLDGMTVQRQAAAGELDDLEVVFSTWGMPPVSSETLALLPNLKAVFYAAGSVQMFAQPFLERGVTVVSAWQANAVPVAEFTLAQILLACKGYWRNSSAYTSPQARAGAFKGLGIYGETVALLGAGAIGRRVASLLKPFHLKVVVFDPFLSGEGAEAMGGEKVELNEAFAQGYVVSNHLANKPETVKMLGAEQFALLRDDAVFINTGRGATVNEAALLAEWERRPSLTALLDVTMPEPPEEGSLLYTLPNIYLTTHIAGSLGNEVWRMADYVLEEFDRWERGEPLLYAVTPELLQQMA